jgi:hypothetical protein
MTTVPKFKIESRLKPKQTVEALRLVIRVLIFALSYSSWIVIPRTTFAREFSASGELIRNEGDNLTSSTISGFQVLVKDCQWMITFKHPPMAPFFDVQYVGCDGTNIYQLDVYNDLVFKSTLSNNPRVFCRGSVFPSNVPNFDYNYVSQLWFAFASGCYLHELTTNRVTCTLLNPVNNTDPTIKATWTFDPDDPDFLREASFFNEGHVETLSGETIILPPPYDHGYTELQYTVSACTNISGIRIPTDFRITVFGTTHDAKVASDLLPLYNLVGTVTNIDLNVEDKSCIPQITQRTLVQDYRSAKISNAEHVDYYAATNWIRDTNNPTFAKLISRTPYELKNNGLSELPVASETENR